jgi:hypothetical protein
LVNNNANCRTLGVCSGVARLACSRHFLQCIVHVSLWPSVSWSRKKPGKRTTSLPPFAGLWKHTTMSEFSAYKVLLVTAFIFQALIDIGGLLGWYYNQYPQEVFVYTGYAAVIPFKYSFRLYLLWIAVYYTSLASMYAFSVFTRPLIVVGLCLSLANSFVDGISIQTPQELFLSWVSWSSYIALCAMIFYAPKISARFNNV